MELIALQRLHTLGIRAVYDGSLVLHLYFLVLQCFSKIPGYIDLWLPKSNNNMYGPVLQCTEKCFYDKGSKNECAQVGKLVGSIGATQAKHMNRCVEAIFTAQKD